MFCKVAECYGSVIKLDFSTSNKARLDRGFILVETARDSFIEQTINLKGPTGSAFLVRVKEIGEAWQWKWRSSQDNERQNMANTQLDDSDSSVSSDSIELEPVCREGLLRQGLSGNFTKDLDEEDGYLENCAEEDDSYSQKGFNISKAADQFNSPINSDPLEKIPNLTDPLRIGSNDLSQDPPWMRRWASFAQEIFLGIIMKMGRFP